MSHKKISLTLTILCYLFLITPRSYAQIDTLNCLKSIEDFIGSHWKRKSKKLISDSEDLIFTKIEHCLIGKNKTEILALFGKPNEIKQFALVYYVDKKPKSNGISIIVDFHFDGFGNCTSCGKATLFPAVY